MRITLDANRETLRWAAQHDGHTWSVSWLGTGPVHHDAYAHPVPSVPGVRARVKVTDGN